MISKQEYDHLKQKQTQLYAEKHEQDAEYNTKNKQQQTATKSQIDALFQQLETGALTQSDVQEKIYVLIESHTKKVIDLSNQYHLNCERLMLRIWDVMSELDRHRNKSFMMGMGNLGDIIGISPDAIHWDIYFRHDKFSELSGVIFLKESDTEWTYPDGTIGSIDQLEEQSLPTLLQPVRWLEGYHIANDILVIQLPDVSFLPGI